MPDIPILRFWPLRPRGSNKKLAGYRRVRCRRLRRTRQAEKFVFALNQRPNAGLRLEDLAEQMRHAYYGDEVHRFQRGRNEVKVMVRLPRNEQDSRPASSLPIRLPNGGQAPLGRSPKSNSYPASPMLIRQDRQRILKIQAQIDSKITDLNALHGRLAAQEICFKPAALSWTRHKYR